MFSSLPKFFDKNFIIGFLIPALLASFAVLYLMADTQPLGSVLDSALEDNDWGKLTLLALGIWALAILLLLGNHGLYRALEGYVGPFKRKRWRAAQRKRLASAQTKLENDYRAAIAQNPPAQIEVKRAYYRELRELQEDFPNRVDLVLPTRFGNVIRAFEMYPYHVYGVDSIPAWLRLQAIIPKEFQALINDARSRVDFFVNTMLLACGIAMLAVFRCGMDINEICRAQCTFRDFTILFPAATVAAAIAARIAYDSAVAQARAWGDTVKSAFDLYLPALAEKLGYRLPESDLQRRRFWDAVTRMFLYWEPLKSEEWPRAPAKMTAPEADSASLGSDEDG